MDLPVYIVFLARLLIATCFIVAGFIYARDWQVYVEKLRYSKILFPTLLLWIIILAYILGGVVMIIGYKLKVVAGVFIVILLLINTLYRRFWVYKGQERRQMLKGFMFNLALVGAVMLTAITGQ